MLGELLFCRHNNVKIFKSPLLCNLIMEEPATLQYLMDLKSKYLSLFVANHLLPSIFT